MKRLDILEAVIDKLETISVANGYNFNLGTKVIYWQDLPFEYGEVGAINVKDSYEEMNRENLVYSKVLNLDICAIKFSDSILEDSCKVLEDLVKATRDQNWGGLSLSTFLISNEKSIETAGKTAIKVKLRIKITYRE